MLVLSRRVDERIIISERIEVKVIELSGNKVKLGITCDRSIPIRRHEIEAHPRRHASDALDRQSLIIADTA